MGFDYVRKQYKVPAKLNGRVRYTPAGIAEKPREGTILGTRSGRLLVKLDGEDRVGNYHPTRHIEYLDTEDGE